MVRSLSVQVRKKYVALVCGHLGLPGGSGELDLPLVRDPSHPAFMRVATPKSQKDWLRMASSTTTTSYPTKFTSPKESLTYYDILSHERLKNNSNTTIRTELPVTRMSLIPVTGR